MALKTQVAPQAYTRDTLSQAYAWLQTQPESVRKMATSPDFLVGLFLRYRRHGGDGHHDDTHTVNFKSDLKNLAGNFKPFEAPPPEPPPAPVHREPPPPPPRLTPHYPPPFMPPPPAETHATHGVELEQFFDERSMKMIGEVKSALNLTSDVEACRALISMGYEHLRGLFSLRR